MEANTTNQVLTGVGLLGAVVGGLAGKVLDLLIKLVKPSPPSGENKDDKRFANLESQIRTIENNCQQCSRRISDCHLQTEKDTTTKLGEVYDKLGATNSELRKEFDNKAETLQRELIAVRTELSSIRSTIAGNEKDIVRVNAALEKLDSLIRDVEAQVNQTLGIIQSWGDK